MNICIIKRFVPDSVIRLARFRRAYDILVNSLYDVWRYVRFSASINFDDDLHKLRAVITASYHNVEKGLSLPSPRPGFGRNNIDMLLSLMDVYVAKFGADAYLCIPVGALKEYVRRNREIGCDVDWLVCRLEKFETLVGDVSGQEGGIKRVSKSDVLSAICKGGRDVITSRSSCRIFSGVPVSDDQIEDAIRVAQSAPVVCNRQSGRVRVFRKKEEIDRILGAHGGARGFAEQVPLLFCVTVDVRNFNGAAERYQGWIDGGMFAMNLLLGLHVQGMGACCLNWSKTRGQDAEMRRILSLPDEESIVVFVAAGNLPDEYVVAKSVRKPLSDVMVSTIVRAA